METARPHRKVALPRPEQGMSRMDQACLLVGKCTGRPLESNRHGGGQTSGLVGQSAA